MDYYLAIDIGSTSGRHIVGWLENGKIRLREVYRFSNRADKKDGHLIWDIERLYSEVINGIRCAFSLYPDIRSLSVDTWGGDYVLMNGDSEILPCYTYRDYRTEEAVQKVHEIIPFDEIYKRVGYQYGPYNTIYQLYSDKIKGRLEHATDFLMMPEYLLYRLSGVKMKEATNNSTTSLVDPRTRQFDPELIRLLGYPEHLFPELRSPGTLMGTLRPEIAREVGGSCDVILCATHDTQSAISVIPMEQDQLYISSGTWSLLGIRLDHPILSIEGARAGFSNESGLEYICYLTNIVGMWIVEQLRSELCPGENFDVIVKKAEESGYKFLIDPNLPLFNAPASMSQAMRQYLAEHGQALPESTGDYFSCAYHSLAASYHHSISALEKVTGQTYQKIYITGGGAKNAFLNRLTEEYTGKEVIPFPIEASTAGNIMFQMKTDRTSA
ncbi:MAG: rhamnulokinase family protein [Lachnospiraceae bacterium]|nr:rhamnulokinase family protein [Lachnospiraceae bacterium]